MTTPAVTIVGLVAETHIHAGIGQVSGAVDLPVARERHTGWPVLPGSGMKGATRDKLRSVFPGSANGADSETVNDICGPETQSKAGSDSAGNVIFHDASILCLPVRTLGEPFLWVTCPAVLRAFAGFLRRCGWTKPLIDVGLPGDSEVLMSQSAGTQTLEDFRLVAKSHARVSELAGRLHTFLPAASIEAALFARRLAIVSDEVFEYFCAYTLPVRQRNALDKETKTANDRALWAEEYLPPDTILYTSWEARAASDDGAWRSLNGAFPEEDNYLQIGGKETIGCGWFQVKMTELVAKPDANDPQARATETVR